MADNDFFLSFNSDAADFSTKIASELDSGIGKIDELRKALVLYEAQAEKMKGGSSPLGGAFDGLDQAAARLENVSKRMGGTLKGFSDDLSTKLGSLNTTLTAVTDRLEAAMRAGGKVGGLPSDTRGNKNNLNDAGVSREQQTILQLQEENRALRSGRQAPGSNAGNVSDADVKAGQKSRKTKADATRADNAQASANSNVAKTAGDVTAALTALTDNLKALLDSTKGATGKNTSASNLPNAEAVLQIANTSSNPVPVVVVGGEAQAAGGHPSAHHGRTPTATTATAAAKARETVEVAADIVNQPNNRKNPSRVMPEDTLSPGQYFLLPGDDQKRPRRAGYGLRAGETAGQYTERVEGQRTRQNAALGNTPGLSDEDRQLIERWVNSGGKARRPISEDDTKLTNVLSEGEKGSGAPRSSSGSVIGAGGASRKTNQDFGGPIDQWGNIPDGPDRQQLLGALRRRDLFGSERNDAMYKHMRSELRRDPHLTQDGLDDEAKAALRRIDNELLGSMPGEPEVKAINPSRIFGPSINRGGQSTWDRQALMEGAQRRRFLAASGAARYEEQALQRGVYSEMNQSNLNAAGEVKSGKRGKSVFDEQQQKEKSDADLAEMQAKANSEDARNKARQEQRLAAQSRAENSAAFAARTGRLEVRNSQIVDPDGNDGKGAVVKPEVLQRQMQAMVAQERAELEAKAKLAEGRAARYTQDPTKRHLVDRNRKQAADLRAQAGALGIGQDPDEAAYERSMAPFLDARAKVKDAEQAWSNAKDALKTQGRDPDAEIAAMTAADSGHPDARQISAEQRRNAVQSQALKSKVAEAKATLDALGSAPRRPTKAINDAFLGQVRTISGTYAQQMQARYEKMVEETIAERETTVSESATQEFPDEGKKKRSKAKLAGDQARAAASGSESEPGERTAADVKRDIAAINRSIAAKRKRADKTVPGSDKNQRYTEDLADLQARADALKDEKRALNNARVAQSSSSSNATPAPTPAPAPAPAPATGPGSNTRPKARRATPVRAPKLMGGYTDPSQARQAAVQALDPETQLALEQARIALQDPNLSDAERTAHIGRATGAVLSDSQLRNKTVFPSVGARVRTVTGALGLDTDHSATRTFIRQAMQQGGIGDQARTTAQRSGGGTTGTSGAAQANAALDAARAQSNVKVREAMYDQIAAQERLNELLASGKARVDQIAAAEKAVSRTNRNLTSVQTAEGMNPDANAWQRITGRQNSSFGRDLMRHGAYALENTIGYSVVFTGFEKLREIVHTGIEAQAVFVRLQATLDANGVSANGFAEKLNAISAKTATPIEHVIDAASELAGSFNDITNATQRAEAIITATDTAAQLANISDGTLNTTQAAVGIRDLKTAYGGTWAEQGLTTDQGLAQSGDQIAKLSQLTGVSIKDITEGTTQIAQEAKDFGLSQREAASLAAYVTKGTGMTGEESAAQTARMLTTLYNGNTQQLLVKQGVATEDDFRQGNIGGVLRKLIAAESKSPEEGGLNEQSKQLIAGAMGSGITGRAFAAIMAGGNPLVAEMDNDGSQDSGTLAKQNQMYLDTISGQLNKLKQDFENLGTVLTKVGALDIVGIVAGSLDKLFVGIHKGFDTLSKLIGDNPLGTGIMHMGTILLEAAAAWKIFGGMITNSLGRRGMLPTSFQPVNAAAVANGAKPEFARASLGTAARAIGTRFNPLSGFRDRWAAMGEQSAIRTYGYSATLPGQVDAEGRPFIGPQLPPSSMLNRVTQLGRVRYGANDLGRATSAGFRGTEVREALKAQDAAMNKAVKAGANPDDLRRITKEAPAAAASLRTFGLTARQAAVLTRTSAIEQGAAMATFGATLKTAASRMGSMIAGLAAQIGLMAVIGTVISSVTNENQRASDRKDARQRIMQGSTNVDDLTGSRRSTSWRDGGFTDFLYGDSTSMGGSFGNAAKNIGEGAVNLAAGAGAWLVGGEWNSHHVFNPGTDKNYEKAGALYDDLANRVYHGSGVSLGPDNQVLGNLDGNIHDALPKAKSVEDVASYVKDTNAAIDAATSGILDAAGSDENKAEFQFQINKVKEVVNTAAATQIAKLKGFKDLDLLNSTQAAKLAEFAGTISGYDNEMVTKYGSGILEQLKLTGISQDDKAYTALANAFGGGGRTWKDQDSGQLMSNKAGDFGRNETGQYGYYTLGGQFIQQDDKGAALIDQTKYAADLAATQADPNDNSNKDITAKYANGYDYYGHPTQTKQNVPNIVAPTNDGTNTDPMIRSKAISDAMDEVITADVTKIQAAGTAGGISPDSEEYNNTMQSYQNAMQIQQQQLLYQHQNPVNIATGRAQLAMMTSGTQSGGLGSAVSDLQTANGALQAWQASLTQQDQQYWANLTQIQQNKQQIAQLQFAPQMNAIMLAAASTADATRRAELQVQQAQTQLSADTSGGADAKTIGTDRANIAGAQLGLAQTQYSVFQAGRAASQAGTTNDVTKAEQALANALQDQAKFRSGQLADQAAYQNAVAQEKQARIQLAVETQALADSEMSVTQAQEQMRGDALGAALTAKQKADSDYASAVRIYGSNTKQANDAMAAAIMAQGAYMDAALEQLNSALDLQIAQLNSRGKGDDLVQAARLSVTKAQNALAEYFAKGGKTGTAEFNKLQADVATSQRSAFDSWLQDQLTTLDFQQQTYKITSTQEIQALQEILKNKDLTKQEMMDITLKIKGLQDDIRSQLTQGGMNIASGITLPSAYQVRRSLGAGFGTNAVVTNNNQQVTVNNNVPNDQVAATIASQVIALINQQTSMGIRASSSTPRLTGTR